MEIVTRDLRAEDVATCESILNDLPEWFGLEAANRAYIARLSTLPAVVAEQCGQVIGFLSITQHNPRSAEIEVLAVDRSFHRNGVGRGLLRWAEAWCRVHEVAWLHVKTRGPATPDPCYERTRRFYLAEGFDALFESTTLWGPEDAALILVRRL